MAERPDDFRVTKAMVEKPVAEWDLEDLRAFRAQVKRNRGMANMLAMHAEGPALLAIIDDHERRLVEEVSHV
jgi:phosphodiesterase/alkaline phosphatase D-like protein